MTPTTQKPAGTRSRVARRVGVSLMSAFALATGALAAAEPAARDHVALPVSDRYSTGQYQGTQRYEQVLAAVESDPGVTIHRLSPTVAQHTAPERKQPAHIKISLNTAPGLIAVIYPDIGEPYRAIFTTIIQGIEDKAQSTVMNLPVGADDNPQQITERLRKQNIRVVIALGRHGLRIASSLDRNIGIVGGGVISTSDADARALSVQSLAPDPQLLFERLKRFSPAMRRVFVVFNPQHNAWLIRVAQEAARIHEIELVAYEARDLKSASLRYREILATMQPRRDALWLPQDSTTVEDTSVLPLILEEAWNRSLVVFSSNVAHVRRGALFALYPNNTGLGRDLATSALEFLATGNTGNRGVVPLKNVLLAVNVRTASHLGIQMSHQQQREFDLVFPER